MASYMTSSKFGSPNGRTSMLPRRQYVKIPPPPPQPVRSVPLQMARTAYYDPSRVIDESQLKLVESIAEEKARVAAERDTLPDFAAERGDVADHVNYVKLPPPTETKPDVMKLLAGLAAAYFLLG